MSSDETKTKESGDVPATKAKDKAAPSEHVQAKIPQELYDKLMSAVPNATNSVATRTAIETFVQGRPAEEAAQKATQALQKRVDTLEKYLANDAEQRTNRAQEEESTKAEVKLVRKAVGDIIKGLPKHKVNGKTEIKKLATFDAVREVINKHDERFKNLRDVVADQGAALKLAFFVIFLLALCIGWLLFKR